MEAVPATGVASFGPRGRGSRGGGGFRGRGGQSQGSPFAVGGGRGRGRGRGASTPSGGGRGRGGPAAWGGGGRTTSTGGEAPQSLHSTEMFLIPEMRKHASYMHSFLIRNLPVMRLQDSQALCDFIALHINAPVTKISYRVPIEKSEKLAAICYISEYSTCLNNLHGQVFRDHHLLVVRTEFQENSKVMENCIKVRNLSTAVTVDTLWNFFEGCGHLGMISLRPGTCAGIVEALVNFEDSDSVKNALKLNGATLDKTSIEVVHLDRKLSVEVFPLEYFPEDYLASILRDIDGVTHVEHVNKNVKCALVFLSDEKSYSAALNLNGQSMNGRTLKVTPPQYFLYTDRFSVGNYDSFHAVLNTRKVLPHPMKFGVLVLHFDSQSAADTALKSSPVFINGKSMTLWDSVSKVSPMMDKFGVKIRKKHSKEMEDREKMLNELENLKKEMMHLTKALGGVSKPTNDVKVLQNILPSKRKRNDTKAIKESKKKLKCNE